MPPYIVTCHYQAYKYLRCTLDAPSAQAAEQDVRAALSSDLGYEEPSFQIKVLTADYSLKKLRVEPAKTVPTPANGLPSRASNPPPPQSPVELVHEVWRVLTAEEIVRLFTELTTPAVRRQILASLYDEDEEGATPAEEPPPRRPPPAQRRRR